jgi:drug/metabolite transporter (DMT)-like permease
MSKGTFWGLIGVAMWSITTVMFAYIHSVPPMQVSALIFFFGWVTMTIFQLARGEDIASYWKRPAKDYLFWLSTAGFYTVLITIALRTTPVFEANILNYLWPVLLIVFAATINKEKVTPVQYLGGFIGFAGAITVFLPANGQAAFADFQLGHALSLFSAAIWAFYSAVAKRVTYPVGFLGPVFLVYALIAAALHFAFEKTVMPDNLEWIIVLILGFGRISYVMWDYGMKHGDVILLASLSYFLPLITSFLLWALGFGPHGPMMALGAVMIIASCLIVNSHNLKQLWVRRVKT